MEVLGHLSGGAPVLKRFLCSADLPDAGVPVVGSIATATEAGGIKIITDAETEPMVGLTVDTNGVYPADADGQVNADADVFVTVSCRPDAIVRCKMSGSTTEDTALDIVTNSTANAAGHTITGDTWLAHAQVWGYQGSNVGAGARKADDTTSVGVSFPNALAVGDTFLYAVGFPGYLPVGGTTDAFFNFSTLFTQADANSTDANNNNYLIIDAEHNDFSSNGSTNSYYHVIAQTHMYGGGIQNTLI